MTFKPCGSLAAAMTFLVLNLAGCGGPGDAPDLGQVTGTITMDGTPLSGVAVMFSPLDGRPAMGKTDAEGKYELNYIRSTKGTKLGKNKVQIGNTEEEDDPSAETGDDAGPAKKAAKSSKAVIPARYNTRSELEVDVKAGENVFDFQLESK
ncbi:hypothetical protein Pan44_14870 [Caulifigura coniformis]|uniref:Carboxypeptidase regulatory-like domain-containing protein n=1 Tax=Caulifigura coniformis TaxID=2527983 RepID=A0A517SBF7_9PLAN|nr:carboxypeptidase regulatory-like domain-containing protein [Caulifigura coniformis]QDT53470.1 hypothetical protein Pan44_14870 [Caulifigura coniformis]